MKKKNNKGFSLIELIIAIAILVILTGLLAPQFMKYIEKSREAKDMQTLDLIYTGVQGALADEAAVAAVVDGTGSYTDFKKGIKINDILDNEDKFAEEVKALLGTNDFKLESKDAKKSGATADIYVRVYDNLEVAVYAGTTASNAIPTLTVGTMTEPETEPESPAA